MKHSVVSEEDSWTLEEIEAALKNTQIQHYPTGKEMQENNLKVVQQVL